MGRKASGVAENLGEGCHGVGGGVDLSQGYSTPKVAEGPRGDETPGDLAASRYQRGEGGRGRGRGDKNPPTAQATRRQVPDGGDGAARNGQTAVLSAEIETVVGDSGEGSLPKNFNEADGARTKNCMHPRREYKNVASEVSERGQASAGAAAGEDSHGATETRTGWRRAEKGDKNP